MSVERALSGETYTTCVSEGRLPARDWRTSESRQMRNAASVLPDPVGAEISTSRPLAISLQPLICGSVGDPKRLVNHSATSGSKLENGITEGLQKIFARSSLCGIGFSQALACA